jgi:hypothetical protein
MKPITIMKKLAPESSDTNITKSFKPKNYSVPMDFSGDEMLYIYKKPNKNSHDTSPDFLVCMYNLNTATLRELSNFKNNIKLLRIFKSGFIYVRENKTVFYYDMATSADQFLFGHSFTIVTMAADDFRIATVDKEGYINIFNFTDISFYHNEINLMQVKSLPKDLTGARLFEMDYPYFSTLSDRYLVFTCDFGTVMIEYNNQKVTD